MEGNLLFKINIRRDDLKDSFFFFALRFWGAYIWRGLFSEFYGT